MSLARISIVLVTIFFSSRASSFTDADFQNMQKLLAITVARVEKLSKQNEDQQNEINGLSSRLADLTQKYAQVSQQRDQLVFDKNVFASTAYYKESSVPGLYHVYQLSPSRVFYPSNYHTHCSGNLCQTYSPNGPICNWPYN